MLRPSQNPARPARPGAERRRERRYQVDLLGTARVGGESGAVACPVLVSDLSASGALVTATEAGHVLRAGTGITLLLEEFGAIEARVVHVGDGFYGLSFANPHLHRDRLAAWLREEVGGA